MPLISDIYVGLRTWIYGNVGLMRWYNHWSECKACVTKVGVLELDVLFSEYSALPCLRWYFARQGLENSVGEWGLIEMQIGLIIFSKTGQ